MRLLLLLFLLPLLSLGQDSPSLPVPHPKKLKIVAYSAGVSSGPNYVMAKEKPMNGRIVFSETTLSINGACFDLDSTDVIDRLFSHVRVVSYVYYYSIQGKQQTLMLTTDDGGRAWTADLSNGGSYIRYRVQAE